MNDRANTSDNRQERGRNLVPAAQAVPALQDPYGHLAAYGGGVVEQLDQSGFNLLEYWRILYKRKWLILSIVAAFTVLVAVRTLMQTPLFTATVRVQIDPAAKIVESGNIEQSGQDYTFMQTQYELLRSHAMAERVASKLKLGDDADFFKPRELSLVGAVMGLFKPSPSAGAKSVEPTALEQWAAGIVSGNVAVNPVFQSRLIDISYSDPSPNRAQSIANAYADAFIDSNVDKRFKANESAKVFLDDKIKQLKKRLEDSEKELVAFAEKHQQLVVVQEKESVAETNLASASAELGQLISQRTKNEELWRQTENTDAINLPQLLSDPLIGNLRAKRNELDIEYQKNLQMYKPGYPAMVQIHNQIEEIDRQIATDAQTIKDSLKAAYESSLEQEEATKARVAQLKTEVLELQKRSIEYNNLKREVDTNRELYTSLLQRYKEVDVASGVGANNVFIVDQAGPGAPSSRGLGSALLRAIALGFGLGLGAAYLLEKLDDKLRSVEQIEQMTGLTVLGVIPKVDALEEQLADARSSVCEAYRSLGTALQFTTEHGVPKTLFITSAGPGEGKSFTAFAIAKHFATIGRKVLLVDADLRNPSLHVKLERDNSIGLSNYLTGSCSPPQAMQSTGMAGLALMASGPLPPNAADLLGSARLVSLLSIGSEVFDLIVIDGPPVLGLADAQLLSSAAAATLFVIGAGKARKGFIGGALKRLQLSQGSLLGAVLTSYDAKAAGYGYGYGYGYGNEYAYSYGANANPRGLSVRKPTSDKQQPQLADTRENA